MRERKKFRVPWDEKTSPGPVPERVKLDIPWDEAVPEILYPPIPGGEKRKSKRDRRDRRDRA